MVRGVVRAKAVREAVVQDVGETVVHRVCVACVSSVFRAASCVVLVCNLQ